MKINEIITEEFNQFEPQDISNPKKYKQMRAVTEIKQLADIIETNCSQMLSAYQKTRVVLLRGIRYAYEDTVIANIRPDRKPMEMAPESHEKLHDAYLAAGLTATRTNSIFCTTNIDFARSWGEVYIIFVKNGWSGTVFKKYPKDYSYYKVSAIANDDEISVKPMARKIKELGPVVVTPQNLPIILNKKYEDILITGSSYIGIRVYSDMAKNLMHHLQIFPKNI